MNLKNVIGPDCVKIGLAGSSKPEIIAELVDLLLAAGKLRSREDRDEAIRVVLEREQKMSTGMQNGIAIPHGKTDRVDTLVAAIGIKKEGVDFDSLDGQPCRIFVMTLSPTSRTGPHIQFLAQISRTLNDPHIREQVLNAQTPEAVLEVLAASEE